MTHELIVTLNRDQVTKIRTSLERLRSYIIHTKACAQIKGIKSIPLSEYDSEIESINNLLNLIKLKN